MSGAQIRVLFEAEVPMTEVVDTLKLAELATQSLHGSGRTELEVSWDVDRPRHAVAISTTTEIGRAFAAIFCGYARREFGDCAMVMERDGQLNGKSLAKAAT